MRALSTAWARANERKIGLGWASLAAWIASSVLIGLGGWFFIYSLATQASMETWARYAGRLQANASFEQRRYRLLELSTETPSRFTGRTDGPFEIWTWTYYPRPALLTVQTADTVFVEAFNEDMRRLWTNRQSATDTDAPR